MSGKGRETVTNPKPMSLAVDERTGFTKSSFLIIKKLQLKTNNASWALRSVVNRVFIDDPGRDEVQLAAS